MAAAGDPEVVPHDELAEYISTHFANVDVVSALGGTFFSVDAEKHWPNFATIVTTDEHDLDSNLTARGAYRLLDEAYKKVARIGR